MAGHGPMVLIVCGDSRVGAEYIKELGRGDTPCRLLPSERAVREILDQTAWSVTLLDETSRPKRGENSLEGSVSFFAQAAPVVVVAEPEQQAKLAPAIVSGRVDFVVRRGNYAALAAGLVERRVRLSDAMRRPASLFEEELSGDFGEILRHEVNNPLTGILGNAELLLAGCEGLPPGSFERLKTIAQLAVRLRETVRRLSRAWSERDDRVRSA
jgi:signal transduction histidine kinase